MYIHPKDTYTLWVKLWKPTSFSWNLYKSWVWMNELSWFLCLYFIFLVNFLTPLWFLRILIFCCMLSLYLSLYIPPYVCMHICRYINIKLFYINPVYIGWTFYFFFYISVLDLCFHFLFCLCCYCCCFVHLSL